MRSPADTASEYVESPRGADRFRRVVGLVRVFLHLRHRLRVTRELQGNAQRRAEALTRLTASAEAQRVAHLRAASTRRLLAGVAMDLHASQKVRCRKPASCHDASQTLAY